MSSTPTGPGPGSFDITDSGAGSPRARPWIQVWFRCANQYQRVFRHQDGTGYTARCGSCGKCLRFRTAPGGTQQRRFEVDCRG